MSWVEMARTLTHPLGRGRDAGLGRCDLLQQMQVRDRVADVALEVLDLATTA